MKVKTLLTVALLSGCISAQAASKIATVDFSLIYSQMPELSAVATKLDKEFKPEVDKLKAQEIALNKSVQAFQEQSGKLNKKELTKKQGELKSIQTKLRTDVQSFAERKETRQLQERDLLVKKAQSAIKDIATRKGYDMVVDKSSIAWAGEQDDLTKDVMKTIK